MRAKPAGANHFPIAIIVIAALAYRVFSAAGYTHKADAVVIALMANDIANLEAFPLVYYGQHYMGSIEAWITALLFIFIGPTWWGVVFAPVLVSTAGVVAFYLLGRSLGGTAAGIAAALLWAISPFAANFYNISPRGCYPEAVCGGTAVLWYVTQRWKGVRFEAAGSWLAGLVMGLLLWASLIALPYVAVVFVFIILADRFQVINRENGYLVFGFVIGLAPVISMMGLHGTVVESGLDRFGQRLTAFMNTGREFYLPYADFNPGAAIIYLGWTAIALTALSAAFIFIYPFVNKQWKEDVSKRNPYLPLLAFTILFFTLYLINDRSLGLHTRYFLPFLTTFVVAKALVFGWLWGWRRTAGVVFLTVVLASNFSINYFQFQVIKKRTGDEMSTIKATMNKLETGGIKSVIWADYDGAHIMTYESLVTGSGIAAMSLDGSRMWSNTSRVEADPDTAVVLYKHIEGLKRQLKVCCGEDYQKRSLNDWEIISRMRPKRWPSESIPVAEWILPEKLGALGDRKYSTTIATNKSFTVQLKQARVITKIRAIYGGRLPELTAIKVSEDGENWIEASPPAEPSIFIPVGPKVFTRSSLDWQREWQEWNFEPVKASYIKFDITHPEAGLFDIHELFIYESVAGKADSETNIEAVCESAESSGVKTLAVDRWISARLNKGCGRKSFGFTKPSLRPVEDPNQKSRYIARHGFGVLTEASDTSELAGRLTAKKAGFGQTPVGDYTLFTIDQGGGEVWWTGFTLIDY